MKNMILGVLLAVTLSTVMGVPGADNKRIPMGPPKCGDCDTPEKRMIHRLNFYSEIPVKLKMPYTWGGYLWLTSFDCRGFVEWVFRQSGYKIRRMTSRSSWYDQGGMPGKRVEIKEGTEDLMQMPTILYWTYKPSRPFGHQGIAVYAKKLKGGKTKIMFREASWSKQLLIESTMYKGNKQYGQLVGIILPDLTPGF